MAGAYPGFCSMKHLRVLLLPPGWDASPLQGYPQQYVAITYLYTWVERDNVGQSILSKETARWQGLGIEPPTFRSEVQHINHYTTVHPQEGEKGALPIVGYTWRLHPKNVLFLSSHYTKG